MVKQLSDFDRIPMWVQAVRSGSYWREELLQFADHVLERKKRAKARRR